MKKIFARLMSLTAFVFVTSTVVSPIVFFDETKCPDSLL